MSKRRRDAKRAERGAPRASGRSPRDAATTRRDRRGRGRPTREGGPEPRGRGPGGILRDVLVLAAAFGLGVGVAELFGAANLGVAFGVGQVVFAVALVVMLTRD